jgi:hypothetical protein
MTQFFQPDPESKAVPVSASAALHDNGGRRWDVERRRFSYTSCIPERRSGQERRSGKDRRHFPRLAPAAGFFRP